MKRTKKLLALLLCACLLAGCSASADATQAEPQDETAAPSAAATEAAGEGAYTPGTYTGSGTGMHGTVTATITVDENAITAAEVDISCEDQERVGESGADTLTSQIMEAQSADIDGISGATVTSDAIRAAAADALNQASGAVSAELADGTYTGTGRGSRSDITVEVTISGGAITDVQVTSCGDSPYVSDSAIEAVSQRIVEAQSVNVDSLTGASLTSTGIKAAVSDALVSAGANLSDWSQADDSENTQGEDVNVDVLVVGGGASGLMAALAAKTDSQLSDTDSGLNVLVVESNGYGGGNMTLCGGYIASYFGTPLNEATGVSMETDELIDALEAAHPEYADVVNDYLLRQIIDLNDDAINGLLDRGFALYTEDAMALDSTALSPDGSAVPYTTSLHYGDTNEREGFQFGESLTQIVEEAGVEIRLETTATDLIMDGNTALGVTVEDHYSIYNIYADAIILATGYAGLDDETVEMFLPEEYGYIINQQNDANRSFAQKEMVQMGGDTVTMLEMGYLNPAFNTVLTTASVNDMFTMPAIWVNSQGERFMDETADTNTANETILAQENGTAWMIFDSTSEGVAHYELLATSGLAWQADTIEELAELAGLPADALAAAVEQYTADAQADGDTVYGVAKEDMASMAEGPYYAAKFGVGSPAGIDVSIYGNENMQVLMTQGGEPIENLYGAGGVLSNGYITLATIGFGTHVNASLLSGVYAGSCVRDALAAE